MRTLRSLLALLRYVSLRHALRSPLRSALVLFGVALGVTMFVGLSAANQAVLHAFDELSRRASRDADLSVTHEEAGLPLSLVDALRAQTELVARVAPRIERTTFLAGPDDAPGERVLVIGADFAGEGLFQPQPGQTLKLANPMTLMSTPNGALVSERLAAREGLQLNAPLRIRTSRGYEAFRVIGILPESARQDAFGGQWVLIPLPAARAVFGSPDRVDTIDLALAPGVDPAAAKGALQALVADAGTVERPGARAEQVARMTASFQLAIQVQALVGLIVGMFLIANAVSVSVSQRRREIGILRSVGVSRKGIAAVFVGEAALVGALGSLLGLALALRLANLVLDALAPSVSRLYEAVVVPEASLSPGLAAVGLTLGVLATMLAALGPAALAARLPPVEAMQRDTHGRSRGHWPVRAWAVGGALVMGAGLSTLFLVFPYRGFFGVALTLLGSVGFLPLAITRLAALLRPPALAHLGVPGRLGVDNVERELGRSTITAAALVLATGASLTVATYTESFERSALRWIDQAIPADLILTAGSPVLDKQSVPFDPAILAPIDQIAGIEHQNRVRSMALRTDQGRMEVLALDSEIYLSAIAERGGQHVLAGPSPLPRDALSGDAPSIVISEGTARRRGLGPGDRITLPSPTGAHPFQVVAVVVDYSSDQGWGMMDRRWLNAYWLDDQVDAVDIFLRPDAAAPDVAEALRAALKASGQGGLFVSTNAALRDEVTAILRATTGVARAAEVIALIVAALGVVGTMLAAVLDRAREVGLLRAIGATRRQILASILAEAGFLGLVSAIVATIVSGPTALVLLRAVGVDATGWSIPYVFPAGTVARTFALVLVCAVASGVLPGLYAARAVLTRALATE